MTEFASQTENKKAISDEDFGKGFAGCDGDGIPLTSAGINGVLQKVTTDIDNNAENIAQNTEDIATNLKLIQSNAERLDANDTSIEEIKKTLQDIDLDQAKLSISEDQQYLVVTNEDQSTSKVKLEDLFKFIKLGHTLVRNKNGELEVAISKGKGNELEVRDDGLYFGKQAEKSTIFVDSKLGNNNNDGSKLYPYKTLERAMLDLGVNKSGVIYLHSGNDRKPYFFDKIHNLYGDITRTFRSYDTEWWIEKKKESTNFRYTPNLCEDYPRAKIKASYSYYDADTISMPNGIIMRNKGKVKLEGIELDLMPINNLVGSDWRESIFEGNTSASGCVIDNRNTKSVIGFSRGELTIWNSKLIDINGSAFARSLLKIESMTQDLSAWVTPFNYLQVNFNDAIKKAYINHLIKGLVFHPSGVCVSTISNELIAHPANSKY